MGFLSPKFIDVVKLLLQGLLSRYFTAGLYVNKSKENKNEQSLSMQSHILYIAKSLNLMTFLLIRNY